jgi:hypothetical protein
MYDLLHVCDDWHDAPESIELLVVVSGDRIIKFNVMDGAIERDAESGLCIECNANETGELIMPLPKGKYDGYVDQSATQRKIYADVFKHGDLWWSSGDLLYIGVCSTRCVCQGRPTMDWR